MADRADVLAIDTASPFPAVVLLARGEAFEEGLPADRRASEELLPAVRRCLDRAGMKLERVSRLALCAGPGSFTGLRVGLSTAWGFSRAAGVPVETASTLEAMAEAWREVGPGPVWTALDAGRGEVVYQEFELEGPRAQARRAPARGSGEHAARDAGDAPLVSLPRELVSPRGPTLPHSVARALALAVKRSPRPAARGALEPIYSRASAAEEKHGAA
ncbi:MAG: tRNA (adenosine(37)-N6)-threonylcarbamoyltransferase complex dimerization subunit type 1 TsaB [Acidobacteriota bacterium]